MSFDWLNSPDYADEFVRSKARLDAVLQHYFELNTPKEHARIIDECYKQCGIEPGAAVPPEKMRTLGNLISSKLTHHVFGLPLEEKLSSEQLARMLSKK